MNEVKKINLLPFLFTFEANPERDEWIKQREKELAEKAEKKLLIRCRKMWNQVVFLAVIGM